MAAMYQGLSLGNAAIVAPTASVIGAIVPVLYELSRQNPPSAVQFAGIGLALIGIWLVTQTTYESGLIRRSGIALALLAGLGSGSFLVLLGQVSTREVFAPLVVARSVTLGLAMLLAWIRRERIPALMGNPMALLAGALDAGGMVFYLLATQQIRLDVAAVLASLYPASTVILAWALTHETISWVQWLGLVACLAAVALIVT